MKKLLLIPLLFLSFAQAETIQCKVVGVTDGDTITCLTENKEQTKVRLYQIDAPEAGQAYGQKAKQALSDMIYDKTVTIETHKKDKYRRTLGTVFLIEPMTCKVGEKPPYTLKADVNLQLIKQGYAWHYPFDTKNLEYIQTEQEARKAKRGLWVDRNPIAPWMWKKNKKGKK